MEQANWEAGAGRDGGGAGAGGTSHGQSFLRCSKYLLSECVDSAPQTFGLCPVQGVCVDSVIPVSPMICVHCGTNCSFVPRILTFC